MIRIHLLIFLALGSCIGSSYKTIAIEKGKSTRSTQILFETKEFFSASENLNKELSRFSVTQTYKFQHNKKNSTSVKMPWSQGQLRTSAGDKFNVEGFKDTVITHKMKTRTPKQDLLGVDWTFNVNLPNGKDRLNANENKVTAALGETGQGLAGPTYGKGLDLGAEVTYTKLRGKKVQDKTAIGYKVQGNYSSLLEKISRKEPGDMATVKWNRTVVKSKKLKYSFGAGTTLTRRSLNFRPGNQVSANPSRLEHRVSFKMDKKRSAKISESLMLQFQERGEIEVQESTGQIVKTEQGDRFTINWTFTKKRSKKLSEKLGIQGTFGAANNNLEVVPPTVGNATAQVGKDTKTRMEEVQLVYGRNWTINKYKKWFLEGTYGLTDDSRDWTLSAGLTSNF